MRSIILLVACVWNTALLPQTAAQTELPDWAGRVGAKARPEKDELFRVNDFGAVNDGKTLATEGIQAAIDACSAKGGGIVTFAPGEYLTGSVFVKGGVHLRIDAGVTLFGSQDLADYPEIETRVAGIEMVWPAALINVRHQETVAISGKGTVHARGKPFWNKYWTMRRQEYEPKGLRWIVDYDCKRPRTLLVSKSSNVTLQDITLKQAGFWTVHILYSQNVTVDGLVIRNNVDGSGPSTDGIDIDSSAYVLVQNCDIDCNDDNFCLKAGRDWDGLRVNRPTEFVLVRDCISRKGGGLFTCGSETSGGIRHVLAYNLKAEGTGVGLRFKSAKTRGGVVADIRFQNIEMNGVGTAVQVAMDWNPSYSYSSLPEGYDPKTIPAHWKTMLKKVDPPERGIPQVHDITFTGVRVKNGRTAISVSGMPESVLKNFAFKDCQIEARTAGRIVHGQGWTFENVALETPDTLEVRNSTQMKLE